MIIAITGHRPQRLNNEYDLDGPISIYIKSECQKIIDLHKDHNLKLLSGMALGADTIFALLALENNIPLIAAVPFVGQESVWPQKSQDLYNYIIKHPLTEKHIISDGGYSSWKMHQRDKFVVNKCDILVAVYDNNPTGGTYKTIEYAKSKNKEIIYINPNNAKS